MVAPVSVQNVGPAETLRQIQQSGCENLQDILNIAATAEAFAVTALGGAIQSANEGTLALPPEAVQSLEAARAAELVHYEFLINNGAQPLTTTFSFPDPALLTDPATFLTTLITLEEAFIAAYIAAAQQFVAQGEGQLARVALQIGAVEGEHRAGVRFFAIEAGVIDGVPNDVAFQQALFASVGEAAEALINLGFIGGEGLEVEYPGPGEINLDLVRNLEP